MKLTANYRDYVLLCYHHISGVELLDIFEENGGYEVFKSCLKKNPEDVLEEVKASGLFGREANGISTGEIWDSIVEKKDTKVCLICDLNESEPGTFKDRFLVERNPHLLIEGILIAAWVLGIKKGYIYIRGEYQKQAMILDNAIKEAYDHNYLGNGIQGNDFNFDLVVHLGAGGHVCSYPWSLITSLEGRPPKPRRESPFPYTDGYQGELTLISSPETLSAVPWIMRFGAGAYRKWGLENSPGTRLFSISGDVKLTGVVEVPLGTPLSLIINEYCQGIKDGKKLKAVFPGGISVPILTAEDALESSMDFDDLINKGSMMGSGGIIVFDETRAAFDILEWVLDFFLQESCGLCSPCRKGTLWLKKIHDSWKLDGCSQSGLDVFESIASNMQFISRCPLANSAALSVRSIIRSFGRELMDYSPTARIDASKKRSTNV
jgi:NADH-quinone oxidoreductase subunit F